MNAATWLGPLCWVFAGIGVLVAIRGGSIGNVLPVAFGICLTFYSLTGETYVPLADPERTALTTPERMWGATSAVLGGFAMVGVLMALRRIENRRSGDQWTDKWLHHRLLFLVLLMSVSIATINLGISRYDLAPSSNFLTDYGQLPGVVFYEVVFAAWIMIPVGALGWMAYSTEALPPVRWLIVIGGTTGVLWGAWKIFGVFFVLGTGDHLTVESPISVWLGLTTLGTCIIGIVGCAGSFYVIQRRDREIYQRARHVEDEGLRRG